MAGSLSDFSISLDFQDDNNDCQQSQQSQGYQRYVFGHMQGSRVETELHDMLSGRYIHRTENVIGTAMRHLFSVNGRFPTWVLDFREDDCTSLFRTYLIFQIVRLVGYQFDASRRIGRQRLHHLRKLLVHHSRFHRV